MGSIAHAGLDLTPLLAVFQGLEKYLLTKLYDRTFAQDVSDRERDTNLAARYVCLISRQKASL